MELAVAGVGAGVADVQRLVRERDRVRARVRRGGDPTVALRGARRASVALGAPGSPSPGSSGFVAAGVWGSGLPCAGTLASLADASPHTSAVFSLLDPSSMRRSRAIVVLWLRIRRVSSTSASAASLRQR
jgi:hypothetical protein